MGPDLRTKQAFSATRNWFWDPTGQGGGGGEGGGRRGKRSRRGGQEGKPRNISAFPASPGVGFPAGQAEAKERAGTKRHHASLWCTSSLLCPDFLQQQVATKAGR